MIAVQTNDPKNPQVNLTCNGLIREAVKADPTGVYFGRISYEDTPSPRKVTLTRGDGGPVHLKLLPITNDNVKAELRELEAGERYELEVSLTPPFTTNNVRYNLALETGLSEAPTASVLINASVEARVVVWPANFSVPRYRTEDWSESVRLTWFDQQPRELLGASVDDPGMTAEAKLVEGRPEVTLKVPLDYKPDNRTHQVTVKTADSASPELTIPVRFVNTTVKRGRAISGARPLTTNRPASPKAEGAAAESTGSPADDAKPQAGGEVPPTGTTAIRPPPAESTSEEKEVEPPT